MQEISMTQKIHNYDYAPGISTYGLPGQSGKPGKDGNNIFFTTYKLDLADDWQPFANKIKENKLPIKSNDTVIDREYINGDLFFDFLGRLYTIINIDKIRSTSNPDFTNCMKLAGKINIDTTQFFDVASGDNRIILNANYKGLDIFDGVDSSSASKIINNNSTMNILSNNIDKNNHINLMQFSSLYNTQLNNDLLLYFNTLDNSYHLSSDYPIVIDGNVMVNYNKSSNSESLNDAVGNAYSKVVLNNNEPITKLKQILNDVNVSYITSTIDPNNQIEQLDKIILNFNNQSSYIHIKNILNASFIRIYTSKYNYMYHLKNASFDDANNSIEIIVNSNITVETDPNNHNDTDIVSLSFIHNIEIFLD